MSTLQHRPAAAIRTRKLTPRFGWVYKTFDAALTAHLRPWENAQSLFRAVVRWRSSNYNRIASLINLVDRLRPGFAERAARRLIRFKHFPLHGYQISLMAYGSGATVFLLEKGQERKALKVFRRSLGQPVKRVLEVAREFQEKHTTLTTWFNQADPVVIPSSFLVLHGPLLGERAAAVLQPYVAGRKHDLLLDFTVEEIVQAGQEDALLARQVIDFSTNLFKAMERTGRCFDLVGRENLMLVETNGGKLRLTIADNGMFDVEHVRRSSPALYEQLQSRLQQLKLIQQGLERR